jgi:hypothetical protein
MTDNNSNNTNETSEVKMRTFRAFDTEADARTFEKFLISTGYENTSCMYVEVFNLWRIWFDIKW